jgi:hypothetical protein
MPVESKISVPISETTRELLEKYVRRTGIKKGHLIEQALLHHLQALDALPAEYVIHPRIVVPRPTGEQMLRGARAGKPTPALRKLMRNRG